MTEESKQIVERLRKEQEGASLDPYGPVDADLYGEAADHIEKLEKEKADAWDEGMAANRAAAQNPYRKEN